MSGVAPIPLAFIDAFGDAIDFIFNRQQAVAGGVEVGGLAQVGDLTLQHLELTGLAMAVSLAIALPIGLWLGHRGRGEGLAVALGNAGRAIPELALIAFFVAVIGVGTLNLTIALAILGIPPILTNAYVAVRQVDPGAVAAARGMGMSELEIITRVELPLGVPTIFSGIRTSAINVVATATIAPLAGVLTLGDFILSRNVYGDAGVLAGAICVALLALIIEFGLAGIQRLLTPRGIRMRSRAAAA